MGRSGNWFLIRVLSVELVSGLATGDGGYSHGESGGLSLDFVRDDELHV